MVSILSPKSRVLLEFILTLDLLELGWVKPIRNKINKESSPFRIDSWLIESP